MNFKSIYQTIQFLSVDVLAGSVAGMIFTIRLLDVNPNPTWWIILPAAVWSFYTIDHLIDGYKSKGKTRIDRHKFHYQHRHTLITLSVFTALLSLILSIIYLNSTIVFAGLIIGLIVLVYFFALVRLKNQRPGLLQKELIISFVYVGGICLAPLIWSGQFPDKIIVCILIVYFLLAWAEGIMASYFDFDNDLKENHRSFTVYFGKNNTKKFLVFLHVLVFLLILLGIGYSPSSLQTTSIIIMAIMNTCMMSIILFPHFFQQNERYRILGENIFLFPALIVFF